jgi:hypothetical protein
MAAGLCPYVSFGPSLGWWPVVATLRLATELRTLDVLAADANGLQGRRASREV